MPTARYWALGLVGQDLEETENGTYRIARRVAKDRVISTVDPEARHGHKTTARGFDGYKGHVAMDPDSEIITQTAVSVGNAGDASVAADLIEDLVDSEVASSEAGDASDGCEPEPSLAEDEQECERPKVYGDAAYGTGEFLNHLDKGGIDSGCKTQAPCNRGGLFPKSRFQVDLDMDIVTCPAGLTAAIRRNADGGGIACFASAPRAWLKNRSSKLLR